MLAHGAPGCGRTEMINATVHMLEDVTQTGVIVANFARGRREYCTPHVVHVDSDHLDAPHIRKAIDQLPLDKIDLLLIESTNNCCKTPDTDLGEQVRVAVFDVTGGDDKAAESARLIHNSSLVLLSKIDLLPHVRFDTQAFAADVARANATAPIIETSVATGAGLETWAKWLNEQRLSKSRPKGGESTDAWFLGLKMIDTAACTCLRNPGSSAKAQRVGEVAR